MACGLPVVAPNQGALSEMVQASGAGRLFEHGDANDLKKQLETLLNDNGDSITCGASGRNWVESEADQPVMAHATAEVFLKVLAEK